MPLPSPLVGIGDLDMVDNLKALSVNVMSPTNNCILKAKVMTYSSERYSIQRFSFDSSFIWHVVFFFCS